MKMKPVVIAVAAIALVVQWPAWKYERADEKLGQFYSQMESASFVAARESIDEALKLWPSNARYHGWRAYWDSQQLPSQCTRTIQMKTAPLSSVDQQSAQEAIAEYRSALALNGHDAVVYQNLGWLEHLLDDDRRAGDDWRQSTQIDPDNAVFHVSYGMFLQEDGNIDAAESEYEIAIELSPSMLDSQFFVRYRNRFPDRAVELLNRCIAKIELRLRLGDDPILDARLGKMYFYQGNLSRAQELLEAAASQLPNLPLVWFNLGEIHDIQGETAVAVDCYSKAKTLDSSLAIPYLKMGKIELRTGRTSDAARDLQIALNKWQRMNPISAAHNNRLYGGPRQTIDDLLPTTLVWFASPCEASGAWEGLSQIFPERKEYALRSHTCEQIPSPHGFLD
ncbi:MAG TPA: tetratricopeptide repeat protein [Candidatus Sulfotelmatobacter sp.]|nr:tetratricopeptide repeat protein [Candidatus Sulfotelmatobacter sp.]